MFKKILGTGATRVVSVMTQLATLIMGTRWLGAAEWGKAFIAQTDITFLLIGIELIAGSGLVYFTPRKKVATLMKISYGWIAFVMLVYLLLFGNLESADVLPLIRDMCAFILDFEGDIPGAKPEECGNYSEQNLGMAKYYIRRYLRELTDTPRLAYPEARA